MAETDQRPTFDEFYSKAAARLVRHGYALTGDMAEAQDIAQEAFARAWQRWSAVRECDSPEAWVRRVATNLAASRWRRIRVARAAAGQPAQQPAPEVSTDTVALVSGLRTLPERQRTVLVLHYMCDLSVDQIAAELDCPSGSVKSWLSRGRTALADAVRVVEPAGLESAGAEPAGVEPAGVDSARVDSARVESAAPPARVEAAEAVVSAAAAAKVQVGAAAALSVAAAARVQAGAAAALSVAAAAKVPVSAATALSRAAAAKVQADAAAGGVTAAGEAAPAQAAELPGNSASAEEGLVPPADRVRPDLLAAPVLFAPADSLGKERLRPRRSWPGRQEPEASHA